MNPIKTKKTYSVAAGSLQTAEAGISTLKKGGNATDAAVAAVFASFVAEPILTGPLGGGFAMIGNGNGKIKNYHFFANAPGLTLPEKTSSKDFLDLTINFGPTTQVFHIGKDACALPLLLPGLLKLHKEYGKISLKEVTTPALNLSKNGIPLTAQMADFFTILNPILSHTKQTRAIFQKNNKILQQGDVYYSPQLTTFFEMIRNNDYSTINTQLLKHFGDPYGRITQEDIIQGKVTTPTPITINTADHTIILTSPPTSGGLLIAFGLKLLEKLPSSIWKNEGSMIEHFLIAMAVTQKARDDCIDKELFNTSKDTKALVSKFLSEEFVLRYMKLYNEILKTKKLPQAKATITPGNTTHISVMDSKLNVCSITTSNGEGCGHILPITGAMGNNFMGEEDIHPHGFHKMRPGSALTSMMCPTLVYKNNLPILALGTGGSNRIRTSLLQVLGRFLFANQSITSAINAPRIHFEGEKLYIETCGFKTKIQENTLTKLQSYSSNVTLFTKPNVFFGGVHCASTSQKGAADMRRGGIVLESQ